MWILLKANTWAHLKYFSRARLLAGFAVILAALMSLAVLPQLLISSRINAFTVIQSGFSHAQGVLFVFSAALGLFLISSHLNARNLKMVFTKPCPPWQWLASAFLACALVAAALDAFILIIASIFAAGFGFHVEAGLLFIALRTFAACVGVAAWLTLLATFLHPVIAALFAVVFNPSLFFQLDLMMLGALHAKPKIVTYHLLERFFHFWYLALPMFHPYAEAAGRVTSSLRLDHGMWRYAWGAFGYDLALTALCYCLALFLLQRKRLI
jgi:ABC-type transport system involved in multi-copper enzyme maturation permease subunit